MKVAPTRPASPDGCTIALAVVMPLTTTVIIAMAIILIIIAKQLKDARYTPTLKFLRPACNTTQHVLCGGVKCAHVHGNRLGFHSCVSWPWVYALHRIVNWALSILCYISCSQYITMHNNLLSACSPGLNLESSLSLRPNMCTTLQI